MKKLVLIAFTGFLIQACGQQETPKTRETAPEQPPPLSRPVFRFSALAPVTGGDVSTNWCYGDFKENVVINAEREKTNRRYFYLGDGTTKVNISAANMVASFLLRPAGDGITEVFNGANYPECLSQPGNFTLADGGKSIRYLNAQSLEFNIDIREENGYPVVTIELPADANFGMNVNHCTNCQ